jgi:hypothetical protein
MMMIIVSVTRWSRIRGEKEEAHKLLQLAATRKNEQTEQHVYCVMVWRREEGRRGRSPDL